MSCDALKARALAELGTELHWPPHLLPIARPLDDLGVAMDLGDLARVAAAASRGSELTFAIISREYIQTGLNWINAMHRLGQRNFLMVAGDPSTARMLGERQVPHVLARIDESGFDPSYVSPTGFTAKGLAVSAFKFPVTRFLVKAGFDVVMSDVDAIWLADPRPHLSGADVAFQRIVYHPPAIAKLWGFGACGGFNAFRHGANTLAFLDRCIDEQRTVFCDQICLNLAILGADPVWHCEHPDWAPPDADAPYDRQRLETSFVKYAAFPIWGDLRRDGVRVQSLPHTTFWRHEVVRNAMRERIVFHPNAPKDDSTKMQRFEALGLRFDPATPKAAARTDLPGVPE